MTKTHDTAGSDAKFLVLGIFNMLPQAMDQGRQCGFTFRSSREPPYTQGWRWSSDHTSTLPPLQYSIFCFSQYLYSVTPCPTDMCALNHGFC